ncbi:CaiB/BaiF CoA transferase family protein [Pseudoroseomonas ludipueritiae]|uniref:CoA transferase n=1 Tax=Pseudoroseomonas ludipueritiae TaxID=198093 RepID=A0ABR7R4S7_9PROT|nr:CoA transferase [Pseudoroseomonas ludipueritiae]MBC9176684.1 CoA transferase [Pseudoroseomonas ludipueritiae]
MPTPLDGIRVVDLTRILSGPFCTMLLGDMGADVVKIEAPGEGDPIRHAGAAVEGLSWYFAAFNRNKRSVVLDLRAPEGREVLAGLLEQADVLVENFRPGVLAEMGFDDARLQALNPRLVVASINGYGASGPYADRPAFDFVIQAMSGFMSVNGKPDDAPLRSGLPITDLVAGLYAAFGIVNALHARHHTGRGQRVEAAMMNGIMSMFAYLASDYLATGVSPVRCGNDHPITAPYGLFRTADGAIAVAPSTEAILRRFLRELALEHVLEDPRFRTNSLRMRNRAELDALITARLRSDGQENWVRRLNKAGVPCGLVQDIGQALSDPQVLHQEMVLEMEHPGHGSVRMLGFPVKLSGTPCQLRHPAPAHGAHTQQVLREWGLVADSGLEPRPVTAE